MKLPIVRNKYGTKVWGVQGESCRWRRVAGLGLVALTPLAAIAQAETTSPLAILKSAPTVRLEDTPVPQGPVPYYPPSGPAPYVAPVYPALTPYAGNTVGGARPMSPPAINPPPPMGGPPPMEPPTASSDSQPDYLNYGQPPAQVAPRAAATPRPYGSPTPRPVLGPEDVERAKPKKKGFVRGLINAIPFVGDDEEEATPAPPPRGQVEPPPGYARITPPNSETEVYRGMEAAPGEGNTLLAPPGAPPRKELLPGDPEPSSPPIMTPTPRTLTPGIAGEQGAEGAVEPRHDAAMDSAPVLTVKREGDETSAPVGESAPVTASPSESSVAPAEIKATTKPEPENIIISPGEKKPARSLDDDSSAGESAPDTGAAIKVEDSRPKAPEPTGIILDAATPPAVSEATAVTSAPETTMAEEVTSLTIEQSDLGMPNPTYEQNTAILAEFQAAVRRARAEDYAQAAQLFREYVANHPSSGLAPRAAFLAVVFEKNNARAKASLDTLRKQFADHHYLKDAEKRRPDLAEAAKPKEVIAEPVKVETTQERVDRLEKELTASVGNAEKEGGLRRDLGAAYIELEEFDRAWEVLKPALELVSGSPDEGRVLLLMARCQMARKDIPRALGIVTAVEEKYPAVVLNDASSAWTAGLTYESGGRYTRARALYTEIRTKWPESQEAGWAEARLKDLAALSR